MVAPHERKPVADIIGYVFRDSGTAGFSIEHYPHTERSRLAEFIVDRNKARDDLVKETRRAVDQDNPALVIVSVRSLFNLPDLSSAYANKIDVVEEAVQVAAPEVMERVDKEWQIRKDDAIRTALNARHPDITKGVSQQGEEVTIDDEVYRKLEFDRWFSRTSAAMQEAFGLDHRLIEELDTAASQAKAQIEGREEPVWQQAVEGLTKEGDFYKAALAARELGDLYLGRKSTTSHRESLRRILKEHDRGVAVFVDDEVLSKGIDAYHTAHGSLQKAVEQASNTPQPSRILLMQASSERHFVLTQLVNAYKLKPTLSRDEVDTLAGVISNLIDAGYPTSDGYSDDPDVSYLAVIKEAALLVADHSRRLSKTKRKHTRLARAAEATSRTKELLLHGNVVIGGGESQLDKALFTNAGRVEVELF